MFKVYILHSAILRKFYLGFSSDDLVERVRKHNSNHKGFIGGLGDWKIVHFETFNSKPEALKHEKKLKTRKVPNE